MKFASMVLARIFVYGHLLLVPFTTCLVLDPSKTRFRARVAYQGSSFSGFQLNDQQRTVQGVLEDVFHRRFGFTTTMERQLKVVGAGRTDAGVHARGQAIHVDIPNDAMERQMDLASQALQQRSEAPVDTASCYQYISESLNKMLPEDCVLWNFGPAPVSVTKIINGTQQTMDWNVLYDYTRGKLYSYRLSLSPTIDPIERHTRWHPPYAEELDWTLFKECLQLFVGTHDFTAFASSQAWMLQSSRVRTVYAVEWVLEDAEKSFVRIDVYLKGALYKQVRNMVGTAVTVASGQRGMTVGQVAELLKSGSSRSANPAKPAPPEGLTLEEVYYGEGF